MRTKKQPKTRTSPKRVNASHKRGKRSNVDELRPHYDFDYQKSRPNRFASQFREGALAVVLDPDVATVFHSSAAVNTFLRSAITAMPASPAPKKRSA